MVLQWWIEVFKIPTKKRQKYPNMNLQYFSFVFCRSTFAALVMVVTVISTASSFVKPTANAYALNCFSIHLFYILAIEIKWCENVGLFCPGSAFFFQVRFTWDVFASLPFTAALTRRLYDWPSCRWHCGCSPSPVGWATVSAAAFGRDSTSATCTRYGKAPNYRTPVTLPSISLYPPACWFSQGWISPFIVCIIWCQVHRWIINQTHPDT